MKHKGPTFHFLYKFMPVLHNFPIYVQNKKNSTFMASRGGGGGGGLVYSVRKLLGGCRGPLKIGPKRIEGKMVFWGQKDRICEDLYPKDRFCVSGWEKTPPKRSSLVPRGSKKGVKTAAHMYHPSYREYPPGPQPPSHHLNIYTYHMHTYIFRTYQNHFG